MDAEEAQLAMVAVRDAYNGLVQNAVGCSLVSGRSADELGKEKSLLQERVTRTLESLDNITLAPETAAHMRTHIRMWKKALTLSLHSYSGSIDSLPSLSTSFVYTPPTVASDHHPLWRERQHVFSCPPPVRWNDAAEHMPPKIIVSSIVGITDAFCTTMLQALHEPQRTTETLDLTRQCIEEFRQSLNSLYEAVQACVDPELSDDAQYSAYLHLSRCICGFLASYHVCDSRPDIDHVVYCALEWRNEIVTLGESTAEWLTSFIAYVGRVLSVLQSVSPPPPPPPPAIGQVTHDTDMDHDNIDVL